MTARTHVFLSFDTDGLSEIFKTLIFLLRKGDISSLLKSPDAFKGENISSSHAPPTREIPGQDVEMVTGLDGLGNGPAKRAMSATWELS